MIRHIATVAVYVADQAQALKFWTEKAGFEVRKNMPMGSQGSWIEVAPKGAESALVIYPKSATEAAEKKTATLVFVTDEIEKTYETLVANGVEFKDPLSTQPWGTFAIFKDNEGNEFVLKGSKKKVQKDEKDEKIEN